MHTTDAQLMLTGALLLVLGMAAGYALCCIVHNARARERHARP